MHEREPPAERRRTLDPTPAQIEVIRQSIRCTAAQYYIWLSAECVEDLVQEVFLLLWRYEMEYKLSECIAYVRRVAANATVTLLRKRCAKKRTASESARHELARSYREASTPEEIASAREEARRVLSRRPALRRRVAGLMRPGHSSPR